MVSYAGASDSSTGHVEVMMQSSTDVQGSKTHTASFSTNDQQPIPVHLACRGRRKTTRLKSQTKPKIKQGAPRQGRRRRSGRSGRSGYSRTTFFARNGFSRTTFLAKYVFAGSFSHVSSRPSLMIFLPMIKDELLNDLTEACAGHYFGCLRV